MVIPVRVEELHEADAAFDQATGEDAIGGVAARTPRIRPIELEDFILLVAEVGKLRHAGLHAVGHLVLADTRGDLGVAGARQGLLIEGADGIQHLPAEFAREAVGVAEVEHGVLGAAQLDALVARGEEAAAPIMIIQGLVARPLHLGEQDEVVRKVAVLAAEAVARPSAEARPAGDLVSGQELRHGRGVVDLVGVHRPDDAEVVRHGLQVREPLAEVLPALAAAFELRGRGLDELLLARGHGGQALAAPHGFGELGAGERREAGLLVEEFDLRRAARLGEEDDALGLGGEVREVGEAGLARSVRGERAADERRERHGAEREPGALAEEVATRRVERIRAHVRRRSL